MGYLELFSADLRAEELRRHAAARRRAPRRRGLRYVFRLRRPHPRSSRGPVTPANSRLMISGE